MSINKYTSAATCTNLMFNPKNYLIFMIFTHFYASQSVFKRNDFKKFGKNFAIK